MTRILLAFGDSNTHGTPPITVRGLHARFPVGTRWPTVTAKALGPDWQLVEEGLPGRTATPTADPVMGAHMDGQTGLRIALASHGPLDLLTIMLGTNDQKTHFGQDAAAITANIAGLLAIARSDDAKARHPAMHILLICPPAVLEQGTFAESMMGAAPTSALLPTQYATLAARWGVGFLDAGKHIQSSPDDGVHLDAASHVTLGKAVARRIEQMF